MGLFGVKKTNFKNYAEECFDVNFWNSLCDDY